MLKRPIAGRMTAIARSAGVRYCFTRTKASSPKPYNTTYCNGQAGPPDGQPVVGGAHPLNGFLLRRQAGEELLLFMKDGLQMGGNQEYDRGAEQRDPGGPDAPPLAA